MLIKEKNQLRSLSKQNLIDRIESFIGDYESGELDNRCLGIAKKNIRVLKELINEKIELEIDGDI